MNKYKSFEELKEELGEDYGKFMYDINLELLKMVEEIEEECKQLKQENQQLKEKIEDLGKVLVKFNDD